MEPIASQAEAQSIVDPDWRGIRHENADELIGDAVDAEINDRRRTKRFDDLDTSAAVSIGRWDQGNVVRTNADGNGLALDARGMPGPSSRSKTPATRVATLVDLRARPDTDSCW